jgi:hypothetical protein
LDELDPPYYDKGENLIEEVSHEDELPIISLTFDEVIQGFDTLAQEKVNTVSCSISKVLMMLYFMIFKEKRCYRSPWIY